MGERRPWVNGIGLVAVGIVLFGWGIALSRRPTDDPDFGRMVGVLVLGGLALVTAGAFALLRAFSGDR